MNTPTRTLTIVECGGFPKLETVSRGVCYRYSTNAGLAFVFDRLRWKAEELHCELSVLTDIAGVQASNGVISQASFSVSSDQARSTRAKRITQSGGLSDVPIDRFLEDACQQLLSAERAALEAISLHDVDEPGDESLFTLNGVTIDPTGINEFYGLPGSGKSLKAAHVALEYARAGHRVGYVDFEWEPGPHKKRARLLYGPQFPDIRYIRLERPLTQEIDGLRRTSINDGWDFAVIDSVSFGCAGAPESAEVAAEFIQATRQLRIGTLLVCHQTKGEGGDKYPFGSIMWFAAGRQIYHFRRSNSEDSSDRLVTAVTHRKSNAGALRMPVAIEYAFTPERIRAQQMTAGDLEVLAILADSIAQYEACAVELAKKPGLTFLILDGDGSPKGVQAWPELKIQSAAAALIARLSTEFGITPSSRSRVSVVPGPKPERKLDKFQRSVAGG